MNPPRNAAPALAAALACLAASLPACRKTEHAPSPPAAGETPRESLRPPLPEIPEDPARSIDAVLPRIDPATPAETLALLEELRAALERAGDRAAAEAIVHFLRTGRDAGTGAGFRVGPEGVLSHPPSLRIALMNWLPGHDPDAALDLARATIAAARSPDECAIALRNLAWNDLDGDLRDELRAAFDRVLSRPGWLDDPSDGLLEALDIAVALGDRDAFATASGLLETAARTDNPPLLRAGFIALDRMVVRDPSLLAGVPDGLPAAQRGALMSRLDPSEPAQLDTLAAFLTDPADPAALDEFARLFPNGNRFHGNWLVTAGEGVPSIDELQRRDRAILAALDPLQARLPAERRQLIEPARARLQAALAAAPAE